MLFQSLIAEYLNSGKIPEHDGIWFNETRDQSQNRIAAWMRLLNSYQVNEHDCIILGAILGELTNNTFDHNLGYWNDRPGCLVGIEKANDFLRLFVVDRGRGIASSLKPVLTENLTNQAVLKKAFEERVSGRAPEKRGNGLKFVVKHIIESSHSLFCQSEGETYEVGHRNSLIVKDDLLPKKYSTFVFIEWRIK